jgi:hypothetical protein
MKINYSKYKILITSYICLLFAIVFLVGGTYLCYDFIKELFFTPPYINWHSINVIMKLIFIGLPIFVLMVITFIAGGLICLYYFIFGLVSVKKKQYKEFWIDFNKTAADYEKENKKESK